MAFPDRLSVELVQRDHRRFLSTGCADNFIAVNEGRLPIAPHRYSSAEVCHQVSLPNHLAVSHLKADHIARQTHDIKPLPINCRSATRTFFLLRPALRVSR